MMWIDDDVALSALIDQAVESDRYALDTEFHREKTYYPKLALLQIRVGEVTALVDPLAINTQMLGRLFAADSLCIIHAAQQDLEVLQHASGSVPKRIFDTQLSSGFIGMSTPSLASLVQNELKISLPKGDRLTDWLRRPLTADQQKYAASDVDYLFVLHDSIMARLNELGIDRAEAEVFNKLCISASHGVQMKFIRMNLEDRTALPKLFKELKFDMVCNLAAQAGVRYSLENPEAYIDSNINGFLNILECCRHHNVKRLVYASSSSIYGNSATVPFHESANVDKPISLYAATKKSNELMAHTYSHLYNIETIGLRFFTVYGPWGRPDMALFLFTEAILNNQPIKVFNEGKLSRDFTYIDDIVEGVENTILKTSKEKEEK